MPEIANSVCQGILTREVLGVILEERVCDQTGIQVDIFISIHRIGFEVFIQIKPILFGQFISLLHGRPTDLRFNRK